MLREKPSGKVIVITGVTRGLGRALADFYIAQGHVVIGCGRGAEGVLDLRFTYAAPHDFAVVDVSEPMKVDLWAEKVLGVHGAPDILINNAAVMTDPAPLWEVPSDKFSRIVDINVKGPVNVLRSFVPAMIKRGEGVIVNFSSGWGRSVSPEVAPYCATKFAVEGLTRALAEELPSGLTAVPLNPGVIDTDMLRQCWADGASSYPKAADWAKRAGPFILRIGRRDNGRSLTVPE